MRAKKTKRARDIEKSYPKADFVAKLRRLADAIETGGRFSIQVAGERLHVPAGATFNIEHERNDGAEELEFQIKWHADQREAVGLKRLS
jgi:amphi-Trp domain-containing protein